MDWKDVITLTDNDDERIVFIPLTDKGKGLLEQLKEIPPKIGNCILVDSVPEKNVM